MESTVCACIKPSPPHPLLKLPHVVERGRIWRCFHLPVNFSTLFTIVLSPLVAFSLAFFWSQHLFPRVPSTPRSPSQNASSGYYTPRARQFYYSVREKARHFSGMWLGPTVFVYNTSTMGLLGYENIQMQFWGRPKVGEVRVPVGTRLLVSIFL